jgi:hypothetical protein
MIQLQDFDYLIRACKKNLVIKLHKDPLLQYRFLFGANLSGYRNTNRILMETAILYRYFFDDTPAELLRNAFGEKITIDAFDDGPDTEVDKSFLLLEHSNPVVKTIGIERIVLQLEDKETYKILTTERGFDTSRLFQFQLMKSDHIEPDNFARKLKTGWIFIRNLLLRYLDFIITEAPRWTETQVEQRVQYYLEHGDHKRAIMVVHGYKRIPPGPTIFATVFRLFERVLGKVRAYLAAVLARIRALLARIRSIQLMHPVMEGVFTLSRMYDYSKQTNSIVFEESPEKIYLKRPTMLGNFTGGLFEGEAYSPRPYVSIINHAVITGGSNLVIPENTGGLLLSDEMVDFTTKDFGIKSPYISYRHKDKVILRYIKKPNTRIKEGILISCDHDNNYFHWLVECRMDCTKTWSKRCAG